MSKIKGMDIVIVIKFPGITDLNGDDAENAVCEVTEAMMGTGLDWTIEEIFGSEEA